VHVVVKGSVEYLGPHHTVLQLITTADRRADYDRWREAMGGRVICDRGLGGSHTGRPTPCGAGRHMSGRNVNENRL